MLKQSFNIRILVIFLIVITAGCASYKAVQADSQSAADRPSIAEFSALLDTFENAAATLAAGSPSKSGKLSNPGSPSGTFHQSAGKFWFAHMESFNANPDDYRKVLDQYYRLQAKFPLERSIKLDQYQATIDQFKQFDQRNTLPSDPVLFIGSSSIVYWETAQAFPDHSVINRGFGGASLEEIIHYYDEIVKPYQPTAVVIYCDINIEMGQQPKAVLALYKTLLVRIEQDFPQAQILLLSMKPTMVDHILGREVLKNKINTNKQLKAFSQQKDNLHFVDVGEALRLNDGRVNPDLFLDGMHLNRKGYQQWNPLMKRALNQVMQELR